MSKTTTKETQMAPTFTITFNRTINGVTSTVTTFSTCSTHGGAILDAKVRARRADRGEVATHSDFVALPARRVLA